MTSLEKLKGQEVHTRSIRIDTYSVDEDRVIVEGVLEDTRPMPIYTIAKRRREPGIVHGMVVRLLLGGMPIEILDAEAEMIFVNDGSTDGSEQVLRELQQEDPRIRIIRFRRNFGKSSALSAGFREARNDVIVTMDADLQDLPSEMHKLIEKLEEGSDLVSGWKRDRKDPVGKRWPSKLFNFVTSLLTGVPLHDMNCGFKAYRKRVVEEIQVYGEMHRYIPVLASYRGFVVSEVPVVHQKRKFGRSKYGLTRFVSGFFDLMTVIMLTRYNRKPLHAFGVFGLVLLALGSATLIYLAAGWFSGNWIGGRPAFMLAILYLRHAKKLNTISVRLLRQCSAKQQMDWMCKPTEYS